MARFGNVCGVILVTFSLTLDFVICVVPAIPKPHSGWPDLIILATFSVSFSEVGSGPPLFVFLVTLGVFLGRRFGVLEAIVGVTRGREVL